MSNHLKFVLCEPKKPVRESLSKMLSSMGYLFLEAECSSYSALNDAIAAAIPDLVVIGIDEDYAQALALIRKIHGQLPDTAIMAVSGKNDGPTILETMRAGAGEFLNTPVEMSDLAEAVPRLCGAKIHKTESSSTGVIAVAGVTGGVGATSMAVNIAAYLAQDPANSVALVDLDLSVGDADIFLDCIPEYTLIDVASNVSRLDLSLMKKSMTRHESGVYLLPRPVSLLDNEIVTPDNLGRVLSVLKSAFSHLVIDVSKSYTPVDLVALNFADHIVLVTQLDLPCLRNVVRLLMSFDEYHGLKEKVKVVVNRSNLQSNQISIKKAEETIGQAFYWQIPNDYQTMAAVRNNGVPLVMQAPQANITQSVTGLTNSLLNLHVATAASDSGAAAAGKKQWLGFLARK
ncbi:MAG: response regulator [Planctomycetaceae bacterium]|nr:response regulator [Planctomycetaceae bacterium]